MNVSQSSQALLVILGDQLFAPEHLPPPGKVRIFMAEDYGLCTNVRHHQQKIVLFLAAMRAYADELEANGYAVEYCRLDSADSRNYEQRLAAVIDRHGCTVLEHFEIEDKPIEQRLIRLAEAKGLQRREHRSPMFLTTRAAFAGYAASRSRLHMADFYQLQRRRLGILVDDDAKPAGGQWSFDADNRRKLPRTITPPEIAWQKQQGHVRDVVALVTAEFPGHPGAASDFCWPSTRTEARDWLDAFVDHRLPSFGPYEDAMSTRSETLFHSLLTPCLNLGLLTPREVLDAVLAAAPGVPLQSLEGFVRQIIGWREFVRGVYRLHSEQQEEANFWSHRRELTPAWYAGTTGIPPLDDAIQTTQRLGWTHHIPRLMVLGNLMTLCEIRPRSAWRWFMEMTVDSADWVMGPNVYGMGLFSDGGLFATKPYICGSNYIRKMSDYPQGEWCDVVDGLYWRFIDRHSAFFSGNPRLALMPKALQRLEPGRRSRIFAAAEGFLQAHTAT